jgi:hypothetical protein
MKLKKYSFGIGDRFSQQGIAQLRAFHIAQKEKVNITPVWNKSYREHKTVHSEPASVRQEADTATKILGWENDYLVDADHINLSNVEEFIEFSDFFTIDVADYINGNIGYEEIEQFIKVNSRFIGQIQIPGIDAPYTINRDFLWYIGEKFLTAIKEAANIYYHIRSKKGQKFIAEVSMDEVDEPQSPVELLMILSGLANYGVGLQTIAPKFTGRFNKGVDYVGDVNKFQNEFEEDLLVIDYAIREFQLPVNLKLSVHSGSDKFSIYPSIQETLKRYDKGVHIKTAGTTWLEEIAGLALAGGPGLDMAKKIYKQAISRFEELTKPYATVIDINIEHLPTPEEVNGWDNITFTETLRHDVGNLNYNPEFRQLLHVAYKVAAEFGDSFLQLVNENEKIIGQFVTENIYYNHIKPIFIGKALSL